MDITLIMWKTKTKTNVLHKSRPWAKLRPGWYLVTIVDSRDNLPEEVSGLPLAEASALADVIIQLPFAGVFHDDHNLIFVLKHCEGDSNTQTLCLSNNVTMTGTAEMSPSEGRGKQLPTRTKLGHSASRGVGQVFQPGGQGQHHHCYWTPRCHIKGTCLSFLRTPLPLPGSFSPAPPTRTAPL